MDTTRWHLRGFSLRPKNTQTRIQLGLLHLNQSIIPFIVYTLLASLNLNSTMSGQTSRAIELYQRHISPLKGSQCLMIPSCSEYAQESIDSLGFVRSYAMITDRLVRCGHDRGHYPVYIGNESYRSVDPLKISKFQNQQTRTYTYYKSIGRKLTDSCFTFVRHLINQQEFHLALLELEKKRFTGQLCDSLQYFVSLGQTLRALDRQEDFLYQLGPQVDTLLKQGPYELTTIVASIHEDLGNYKSALDLHRQAEHQANNRLDSVNTLLAIIRNTAWAGIPLSSTFDNKLLSQSQIEQLTLATKRVERQNDKSLKLAHSLAVIPGGGYAYAGYWGSALTSFILVGAFAWATQSSLQNRNFVGAAFFAGTSLSFYLGGFKGAKRCLEMNHYRALEELSTKTREI